MKKYIHEQDNWPDFTWDDKTLMPLLGQVRNLQGKMIGKMESLGFELRDEANLVTLTLDVLKSTEIEGQLLNPEQVRSSLAKRLGLDLPGLIDSDRDVEGVVDMMIDATQNFDSKLTIDRLFDWHSALFPTGSVMLYLSSKINIASVCVCSLFEMLMKICEPQRSWRYR